MKDGYKKQGEEVYEKMPDIDEKRLVDLFETLVNVPSVVAYYPEIDKKLEKIFARMGYDVTYDHKHTLYVKVPGADHSKTFVSGRIWTRSA